MTVIFQPLDQSFVDQVRADGPDAYGQPAEHGVSDGAGFPCRSCLRDIPAGSPMLTLAACPFPAPQPFAETGPIYLCAKPCAPWQGPGVPPILTTSPDYLLKAYTADHRILYGTGQITTQDQIETYAAGLLSDPGIAYVDVRSARNNCFQTRITRDTGASTGI